MVFPSLKVVMSDLNKEVVDLVWGRPSSGGVSASIFRRWTQGMMFCVSVVVGMTELLQGSKLTKLRGDDFQPIKPYIMSFLC